MTSVLHIEWASLSPLQLRRPLCGHTLIWWGLNKQSGNTLSLMNESVVLMARIMCFYIIIISNKTVLDHIVTSPISSFASMWRWLCQNMSCLQTDYIRLDSGTHPIMYDVPLCIHLSDSLPLSPPCLFLGKRQWVGLACWWNDGCQRD